MEKILFTIVSALVVIFFSMVLHEIAHGLVAYWLGDDTARVNGRFSLNPMRQIDPFLTIAIPRLMVVGNLFGLGLPIFGGAKPVPVNTLRVKWGAWGLALVALAGPLVNFILAFLFFVVAVSSGGAAQAFSMLALQVNLGFLVFNLIPIPPLDGSRVLFALAPDGIRKFMMNLERYGLMLVFMMLIFFSGVFGSIIGTAINAIIDLFSKILMIQ
jgi:Zn-dependent protease